MKGRIASLIVVPAILIGMALTIWGLLQIKWGTGVAYLPFALASFVLIGLASRAARKKPIFVGVFFAGVIVLVTGHIISLLVAAWFAMAASLLGRAVLLRFQPAAHRWTDHFLAGSGICGTAVGLMAFFPVNYPGVYAAGLALPVALGWKTAWDWIAEWYSQAIESDIRPLHSDWLDAAIAAVALVHFVVALMPEVGHDALATHLFVPSQLASRHQWGFDVATYVWAAMPMLGDWIYAIAYMLGGETSARLINLCFILVLGWLVRDMVRVWGNGHKTGAGLAVLLFLSTPLTFTVSSSLFIESVWGAFVVAGTVSVLRICSTEGDQAPPWPLAGLLFGFAAAAKAVTFMFLPGVLLIMMVRFKTWFNRNTTAGLLVGTGFFLILGAWPYAVSWKLTGNPVFPFFNKIFQSPLWPAENLIPATFSKGLTWDVLYRVTFHTQEYLEGYAGAAGFQWLMLLVPVAAALSLTANKRALALLLVGTLSVILTFQSQNYLRYVFPACAMLCAVVGIGISSGLPANRFNGSMWAAAALACVLLNVAFLNSGAFYGDFPLKSIFSQSQREQYLARRLPMRKAVQLVNALNTEKKPVAVFGHPLTAGLSSDALYANWYNHLFQKAINSIRSAQDFAELLDAKNAEYVIFDKTWKGVKPQLSVIQETTNSIAEFGPVAVRKVNSKHRFKKELMRHPDLQDVSAWNLIGEARHDARQGTLFVSVDAPAVQVVPVSAGRHYMNSAVARCGVSKTQGRLQVNWLNAKKKLIRPEIQVFECSDNWELHEMEAAAPPNAAYAAVYASSHTKDFLEFQNVSFRE